MVLCELFVLCYLSSVIKRSDALQCYSCRGQASNEVEANIRCLQNAYLEDCDEFYSYYSEVEDQNVLSYEYYNYEKDNLIDKGNKKSRAKSHDRNGRPRGHRRQMAKEERGPHQRNRERTKRETNRVEMGKDKIGKMRHEIGHFNSDDVDPGEDDYGYYYPNYNYTYDDVAASKPTSSPADENPTGSEQRSESPSEGVDPGEKLSLPKDPEHYCYSRTIKKAWESYAVEKGCKKITYCNSLIEKNPEWGNPWNFCCDKARCNAKLVKDKPQRIFGMGCRQTDDCIQGMTSRPGLIKMECRAKSRTKTKFLYAFKEKKCYCAAGFHPKGPICTSSSENIKPYEYVPFFFLIKMFYVIMLQ
ncbi:hypothetical protein LSH36_1249g00032 [Paralvinella palmiformis]|uniref:Uncharacterized protein n=1 Tax=Paralvinella palmiformis TaxID=53620 RepID=A0AAD9MQW8_9ANNE|nr:hypothetical protein LSH36_1249g00032 [Paralvinella palmiformis]